MSRADAMRAIREAKEKEPGLITEKAKKQSQPIGIAKKAAKEPSPLTKKDIVLVEKIDRRKFNKGRTKKEPVPGEEPLENTTVYLSRTEKEKLKQKYKSYRAALLFAINN